LHDLLEIQIEEAAALIHGYTRKETHSKNWSAPPIPNGIISTSVRLGIAIRYFAGGSPYDIMVKFGVSHTSVFESVWIVVEAVNMLPAMKIEYPSDVEEQKKIAKGFCDASKVRFDCCAWEINGILIWMHKPSMKEADAAGVGQKKILCGRKNKFGLNCQAVSDVRGRILEIGIVRIIALVNALAKLHNFCIKKNELISQELNVDTLHIINNEDGFVEMVSSREHGILLPRALMEPGHHFTDVPRNACRQQERANAKVNLPRHQLLKQVIDSHLKRPTINK